MKKIFCLGLMFAGISYGQVSQGEIRNFNFDYHTPQGNGTAESFSYHLKLNQKARLSLVFLMPIV